MLNLCPQRLGRGGCVVSAWPLAILILAMTASPVKAQVFREWNNPAGGSYDLASNWLTNDVADATNEWALFDIAGTYNVSLTSGATTLVGKFFVFDGEVTFNASGVAPAIFEMDTEAGFSDNVTLAQGPSQGTVTLNAGDLLGISGGSTFSVLQGSDVTANRLNVSSGGSPGAMIVDGTGSTLAVSSLARVGFAGVTGTLTFQNGSTGNSLMGSVELMSNSTQAGSTGRLNVLSGSSLQTGNISVGLSPSASAVQEATLTVDGVGSALTMAGASTLTIGDETNLNVVSNVIISDSAVMSTGTGDILIQNSGHLDVDAGTFNANGKLTVDDGTITLQNDSTIEVPDGTDTVVTGGGTISVLQGSDLNAGTINLGDSGGSGTITVNGVGSTLFNTSSLFIIGLEGPGTLNVEAGAHASSGWFALSAGTGSTGVVTLTGAGSTMNGTVLVGGVGPGTLDILDGGRFTSDYASFGQNPGSNGSTVTVDGAGSAFVALNRLRVGSIFDAAHAILNISNGGLVTVTGETRISPLSSVVLSDGRFEFGTLDDAASSYSRISGSSGSLAGDYAISGFTDLAGIDLSITNLDTSEVRILNSGVIFGDGATPQTLANTQTGELRTLSGEEARFDGIGMTTNAGGINNFDGVVEFVQGITNESTGFVIGRGQFIAGGGWINDGVFAFNGGSADVSGDVTNSATGLITVSGASTTTFSDDVTMDPGNRNIIVTADSTAVFLSAYNGGNSGAGAVDIQGDLRPGNSAALVTYGGNVSFGGLASLEIEIGGLTPGSEFDVLDIVGSLTADGTLDVSLINAFTPSDGDSFDILNWGSITGSFSDINLPSLGGGLDWDTSGLLIDGTLSVISIATLPGDLDGDGFVGINDLNIVLANWNQNVPPANPLADPSGDGFVGIDDLNAVLGNWNAGTPPNAASNIPEPASLGLMLCGASVLLGRKRPVR